MRQQDVNPENKQAARGSPHIVIIGTGFGGLGMAIQLKKAGIESFTILEKETQVGGTWRDNTYPGAACDVQSHLYSFSFEPKSDWSRKFGTQAEIHAYIEQCASKYGLYDHIRFGQEVESATFDETAGQWLIKTGTGDTLQAHVLIPAAGQLNQPAWPRIEGIEHFKGRLFHSARWDHDHDLTGQSVAVIGTGASAIQFVPRIVPKVKNLKLFQRSGAWVIPKPDRPFRRIEQRLFKRVPLAERVYRTAIYWRLESRALAFTRFNFLLKGFGWWSRWVTWRKVPDKAKRKKLIPDYPVGCKRILLSNDWFPAVAQDHVDLVTDDIERVTETGVVTSDGTAHEVDTIIFGTGFKSTDFLAPMTIKGIGGLDLNEAWCDGAEAYKGINVSGFPNLFILYGPNTNLAHNSIVFMLESQIRYVMQCVRKLQDSGLRYLDVKADRQDEYSARMQRQLKNSVWDSGCTSWYKTASGKNTNNWPGFTFSFRLMTGKLELQDYHVQPAAASNEG